MSCPVWSTVEHSWFISQVKYKGMVQELEHPTAGTIKMPGTAFPVNNLSIRLSGGGEGGGRSDTQVTGITADIAALFNKQTRRNQVTIPEKC